MAHNNGAGHFEKAIVDCDLAEFKYLPIVRRMCDQNRETRVSSFRDAQRAINEEMFIELAFSTAEIATYRKFANALVSVFATIGPGRQYQRDMRKIIDQLEILYRTTMLDLYVATPVKLARAFVAGEFSYYRSAQVEVSVLREFIEMLKGLSGEKKNIVLENLLTRLEAVNRTGPDLDDDIPF